MVLPKINYEGYVVDTFNGTPTIAISFKNTSITLDTTTVTWSHVVTSGTVNSSITNEDIYTIFCDSSVAIDVKVTLTLSTGETTDIIIIGDGVNIAYAGVDIDVFILPENNIQFDIKSYTADIIGTYGIINYTNYELDATSNAVIDYTASADVVFSHTYSLNNVAKIDVTNDAGVVVTTIGVEILDISSLEELIVNSEESCTELEVWSETVNYIEKLVGRGDVDNSSMTYLGVTVTTNCCIAEQKEFKLAPVYDFSLSNSTCLEDETSPILIDGFSYQLWNTVVTLNGIDPSIIDTLKFSGGNRNFPSLLTVNTNTPVTQFTVQYVMPNEIPVPPLVIESYIIEITTTAGFVYTIYYDLTPNFINTPGSCDVTFTITDITYPENPCYVTIVEDADRTYLNIDSQLYYDCTNDDLVAMSDGIYQVVLSDSGISNEEVIGCEFVDCETYCLIIKALASECNPIINIIYDSLKASTNCIELTCQNYCDLYEMLLALLEECNCITYTNNKSVSKPCNCK
jgi:hypothetical protein